eukprot:CAMPEP_0171350518 /NCGR_PEP_ID=MMETSP0878-20121228/36618_1 /TAXON_ID=67004 /ORGANISM="Thalassiosira weissflogii, Strain CCMP1336" /LENGTH=57 /DNA_ID=CAMNT_0011855461 /DNA_START=38 /DNA_END=211 /DNA_ORIENTATION=-
MLNNPVALLTIPPAREETIHLGPKNPFMAILWVSVYICGWVGIESEEEEEEVEVVGS